MKIGDGHCSRLSLLQGARIVKRRPGLLVPHVPCPRFLNLSCCRTQVTSKQSSCRRMLNQCPTGGSCSSVSSQSVRNSPCVQRGASVHACSFTPHKVAPAIRRDAPLGLPAAPLVARPRSAWRTPSARRAPGRSPAPGSTLPCVRAHLFRFSPLTCPIHLGLRSHDSSAPVRLGGRRAGDGRPRIKHLARELVPERQRRLPAAEHLP